ncbi:MAG: hypothetical protein R3250_04065 [Melioribacteraceae bacterium]|nr:hypothetical protein [Melioribacteraceae bacterium]
MEFGMEFEEFIEKKKDDIWNKTVQAHYGISRDENTKFEKEILCDLINFKKTDVIDKHFPKLNAEDRAKVMTFAAALERYERIFSDDER